MKAIMHHFISLRLFHIAMSTIAPCQQLPNSFWAISIFVPVAVCLGSFCEMKLFKAV